MKRFAAAALPLSLLFTACTQQDGTITSIDQTGDLGDDGQLVAADDSQNLALATSFSPGDYAQVCNASALNQRSGPGTSYSVLHVMPSGTTVKVVAVSGTWVKNDWSGRIGWSSGTYLCAVASPPPGGGGGTPEDAPATFTVTGVNRTNFISIAKAAVGFSYYWGGGRFANGANPGTCNGSCPSCTHSGSYGGDCSGFAAKVWLLPPALPMDSNKHPYSTYNFYNEHTTWSDVSRSNVIIGDALVHNSAGSGHIVIYEKDDPWGSFWTFEARGCSYGVVHNIRTASSAYKGIRRDGL